MPDHRKDSIEIGDRVDVFFEKTEPEIDLLLIGANEHEFKFKRRDGTIVYVMNYSKMVRAKASL
jgi:hypothetical protein